MVGLLVTKSNNVCLVYRSIKRDLLNLQDVDDPSNLNDRYEKVISRRKVFKTNLLTDHLSA